MAIQQYTSATLKRGNKGSSSWTTTGTAAQGKYNGSSGAHASTQVGLIQFSTSKLTSNASVSKIKLSFKFGSSGLGKDYAKDISFYKSTTNTNSPSSALGSSLGTYTVSYAYGNSVNIELTTGDLFNNLVTQFKKVGYQFCIYNNETASYDSKDYPYTRNYLTITEATLEVTYSNSCTITYNANGLSCEDLPSNTSVTSGSSYTISSQVPYVYNTAMYGYGLNSTSFTWDYPGGDIDNVTANTTLYCCWEDDAWTGLVENGSVTPTFYFPNQRRVYKFTPSTTRKYHISAPKNSSGSTNPNLYLYKNSNTALYSSETSNNESIKAELTAGTTYYIHLKLCDATYGVTSTLKLNAIYKITYDANKGSGAPSAQEQEYGSYITIPTGEPTRTGYSFLGWSTNENATTASYVKGDSYGPNADTTLYAVWQSNGLVLEPNNKYIANISTAGTSVYYSFTPSRTATYGIHSVLESGDSQVYLYNSSNELITNDDDAGPERNFRLTYKLTAGETYRFEIKFYGSSSTGEIPFYFGEIYDVDIVNVTDGINDITLGEGEYIFGETCTVEVFPENGYDFDYFLIDSNIIDENPYSFTMPDKDVTINAYASILTYSITYDKNTNASVSNMPTTGTKYHGQTYTLPSNIPKRTGYEFKGWSLTTLPEGTIFEPGGYYTEDGDCTLYAIWELKKYAITYFKNAGNTTETFFQDYKDHGTTYYIITDTPTREGYKFLGWSTSSTATTPMDAYAAGKPYSTNAIRNLYAVWKKTYTITTQIAAGLGVISSGAIYETGTSITLTASPSSGYKFDMWMDEDGNKYDNSTLNTTVTEDKIFYAYFSIIQYSITFNANGGSGEMDNGTKIYGVDYDLPQSDFTPPNETNNYTITCYYNDGTDRYVDKTCTRIKSYSFNQWRLGSPSGAAYQVGGNPYTVNSSATFYAEWKAGSTTGTVVLGSVPRDNKEIRRTVKFNPNGGTTTPADQIYTETTSYNFKGWNRSSSATTINYNTTTGYGFSSPTTLYGVWGETQTTSDPLELPTISRSTTRQTIQHTFKPQATGLSTTILRTKVITTQYELTGWIDETNNTKLNLSDTYIPTNNSTTLTADWNQIENITGNYTAPTLSRAGYQLLGWSYQSSSSPSQEIAYAPGDEITDETGQTFYAVWAQDIFLITLDHQTGNSSINNLKFQYNIGWFDTDNNQLTSISIPTKTGYIFQGYYTDDNSLIITNTGALSENKTWTNENTTLYAHWTPIIYYVLYNTSPYLQNQTFPVYYDSVHTTKAAIPRTHTITYEKNGGSGGVEQHTSTIHSSYWIDSSNTKISNNTDIQNLTTTNMDIIELKPHWELDVITLPTLTQSGYNFLGWYDSNGVKIGNGGASYTISKDITLYAHWDPIGLVQIRYNGQWRKAIPYIYDGSEWKRAITSIQTSEDPTNPVWQTGINYGQHKLIN